MKTHSVKYNFIMNSILTLAGIVFPLITFPYISRVLLVEGSAKVTFAVSAIEYFTMFATLGIPTYGVRACAVVRDDREKLSKTVQELLIISGVMTVVVYAAFFLSLRLVPQFAEEREILMICSAAIGLCTIGVQWFYSALEQYSYITACAIAFKLLGVVLMFLFVKKPEDFLIYGGIYVIGSYGSYVLNFIRLRKFITFRKSGSYHFKKHLKAVTVFFAMSAGASIYLNLDIVMLRFISGNMAVGYYTAGIKVKTVLVTCVTSLGTVLLPRLSYYIKKQEKAAFQSMVSRAFDFVFVTASAVAVYFMLYAEESILLLSGSPFLPGTLPMIILMPTVLLIGLSNITGIQVLTPNGQENKVMYSVLGGAVLDFGLNLVLIPRYAAAGAACSTMLAEVLVLLIQCVFLRNMLKEIAGELKIWKIVTGLAAAAAAGAVFKMTFSLPVFVMLVLSALLFFGIYGSVLFLLKESFVVFLAETAKGFLRSRRKENQ